MPIEPQRERGHMLDLSSIDGLILNIPLTQFFQQARKLDLDLQGQADRRLNAEKILTKVSEMPSKQVLPKLSPAFKKMAEISGALSAKTKMKTKDESAEEPKKIKKSAKAGAVLTPHKVLKKGTANTGVPEVRVEAKITFPEPKLDKLLADSEKTATVGFTMQAKQTFGFYGRYYYQIQEIFEDLHRQINEARGKGQLVPKMPTMDEYLAEKDYYTLVDRTKQRLRRDAAIFRACQVDGKIPENVMEQIILIGVSKVEEVSALPDPLTAIMDGILFEGQVTHLTKLSRRQVEQTVKELMGRKKPTAKSSRSRKSLEDVPKMVDALLSSLPKMKSSRPNLSLRENKALEKRIRQTVEGLEKAVPWLKETLQTIWG